MEYRRQPMTMWSIGGGLLLGFCALVGLEGGISASAAGVPPAFAQGFSEIVKKTTPAVVNIAVTGGGEGGRRRGGLPPGPFGKPPGEEPGGEHRAQSSGAAGKTGLKWPLRGGSR